MKKIMFLFIISSSFLFAWDFISPIDFKDTQKNRMDVISFITSYTEMDFSKEKSKRGRIKIPETVRLEMEEKELKAFKLLTTVYNKEALAGVISRLGCFKTNVLCRYSRVLDEYEESTKQTGGLRW